MLDTSGCAEPGQYDKIINRLLYPPRTSSICCRPCRAVNSSFTHARARKPEAGNKLPGTTRWMRDGGAWWWLATSSARPALRYAPEEESDQAVPVLRQRREGGNVERDVRG
jgi:hypothetical protein